MCRLQFYLFGRFRLHCDEDPTLCLEGQKVQELLCYLLVHRDKHHFREKLATILWENGSSDQGKQYLRRALWQLQSAIDPATHPELDLITVDADWLQINPAAAYWCDVGQFEDAYRAAEGIRGRDLDQAMASRLHAATRLYQGDLLENWYQDWCIVERERLQNIFLTMLDKLMGYCEHGQEYERGIHYGNQILRCDIARERTYRRLMRLDYLAGNRTGALRRYERCTVVLRQELGVEPGRRTVLLYEQIKADRLPAPELLQSVSGSLPGSLSDLLCYLEAVQANLARAQRQVMEDIESIKSALIGQP